MRLLGQLFLHPDQEQTIAELEQAARIPQQTVSREVNRLLRAGLLRDRRVGRLHFIRPNDASPYFSDLSGLLLKALGPQPVLAERLNDLQGIEEAYIFGSWARRYKGEPGQPPGDIDVLIVGEPDVEAVYAACSAASEVLRQTVNPVILPVADWTSGQSGFVRELRAGPLVALQEP